VNICTFTGFLTHPLDLIGVDDVNFVEFELACHQYRRNKAGVKKRTTTYLTFQAWDSGAETIAKLAREGDKMTVSCSARNDGETINFRVNEFDFGCIEKE